jgi:hypothetical protein
LRQVGTNTHYTRHGNEIKSPNVYVRRFRTATRCLCYYAEWAALVVLPWSWEGLCSATLAAALSRHMLMNISSSATSVRMEPAPHL